MLPGSATPELTAKFAARHVKESGLATGHYRAFHGLTIGTIGLGSYLGEPDAETDERYEEAVFEYVRLGGNVIDTAVNYRAQRSEKSIGRALKHLEHENVAHREEVLVCTKGGYFAPDGTYPRSKKESSEWVHETFLDTGILRPEDIAQGCHAMSGPYLRHQVTTSLGNLGLDCVDVYYVHNPETQLASVDRETFDERLRSAFEALEELASAGALRAYGAATWSGFRAAPTADEYLSLETMVRIAREVAGDGHHFRFVQAPFNLAMLEVARFANQRVGTKLVTLLEAAHQLGVAFVASATILQGRLTDGLPPAIAELLPGLSSDAQRAIQFNRSAPFVATTLVGMKSAEHVKANLSLAKRPPAPAETVKKLLLKLA